METISQQKPEISRYYLSLCETYGWTPSIRSLCAFELLVNSGRWAKWTSQRPPRKPKFKWRRKALQEVQM